MPTLRRGPSIEEAVSMSDPRQWYVLLHRPGPALDPGTSAFDHPDIAEHFAFLRRRAEDGSLVAAGPLTDVDGDGLTILSVADEQTARQLAEQDDRCVREGVVAVSVRRWQVVLAPVAER